MGRPSKGWKRQSMTELSELCLFVRSPFRSCGRSLLILGSRSSRESAYFHGGPLSLGQKTSEFVENKRRYHSIPSRSFGSDPCHQFQQGLATALFASAPWCSIVALSAAAPQRTRLCDRAISAGGAERFYTLNAGRFMTQEVRLDSVIESCT